MKCKNKTCENYKPYYEHSCGIHYGETIRECTQFAPDFDLKPWDRVLARPGKNYIWEMDEFAELNLDRDFPFDCRCDNYGEIILWTPALHKEYYGLTTDINLAFKVDDIKSIPT